MREITVALPDRGYPILIGPGLLDSLGARVGEAGIRDTIALVRDSGLPAAYGERARASLEGAGFKVAPVTVPEGERSKSLAALQELYGAFAAAALDRGSAVVALGGGVVGDLAGFAAATYLRGIAFVQVPTTLLAQVDASVGGKTGIDLPAGKNLVGAFHQPRLVLADLGTLATLPETEFRSGLAEVVKYGVIADPELFAFLEGKREAVLGRRPEALERIVARSCEIKADIVTQDERESGLRAVLNYGHTVGHAVEAVAGYGRYLHGEAVAIGMAAAGALARAQGRLSAPDAERIEALLQALGLPVRLRAPLAAEALLAAMRLDKKARGGELRFVLARSIGEVELAAVPAEEVARALQAVQP
jgi:3-dehydroquinate synthase